MSLSVNESIQPHIFVLHENAPWVEPPRGEFAAIDAPFSEWFRQQRVIDQEVSIDGVPEGPTAGRRSAEIKVRKTLDATAQSRPRAGSVAAK